MNLFASVALAALVSTPAHAERTNDSDLSNPRFSATASAGLTAEGRREGGLLVFPLSLVSSPLSGRRAGVISGRIVLFDGNGKPKPARLAKVLPVGPGARNEWVELDLNGRFEIPAPNGQTWRIRVSLNNPLWTFLSESRETYMWESGPIASGTDAGTLAPIPGSEHAKLGVLHLTYLEAVDFLARQATLGWWKESLTVTWPSDGDFFSPGAWSLNLSNPLAWDVNLHELGHAVMDGAMRARSSGGSHKIDECYSSGLAWSEGWATFFAAAVRLSPDDPDAKFEFLVPRRAPIRIENVPEDVCRGPKNEWRVAAGLWDLYDLHADGEGAALGFGPIWKGVTGGVTGSVGDAWGLIAAGLDPAARRAGEDAMRLNTLLPPRPLVRLPALPRSSARLFDGERD